MKIVIILGVLAAVSANVNFDKNLHCGEWAETDGECEKNPGFMWSSCLSSCVKHAQNNDEECDKFAREGECVNNPNFMHLTCPKACSLSIAWSPWVRRTIGIADVEYDANVARETCPVPSDIFAASELMKSRVEKYLSGAHNSVVGLQSTAPSEYLGMLGLTEGILFVLRLHKVVLDDLTNKKFENEGLSLAMNYYFAYTKKIDEVLNSGYDADVLMREIPGLYALLVRSTASLHTILSVPQPVEDENGDIQADCSAIRGPAFSELWSSLNPDAHKTVNPFLAKPPPEVIEQETQAKGYTMNEYVTLYNKVKMPRIGLGTWQLQGQECIDAVYDAITVGYRLFDTAEAYRNEEEVGIAVNKAIDEGLVTREELFIATKQSDPEHAGYDGIRELIQSQLDAMQLNYFDLYMLHSPLDKSHQGQTWLALEELHKAGILRAIGVSNFDGRELRLLVGTAKTRPMMVQNKLDVYHYGKQLDNKGDTLCLYAKSQQISVQAYSTLSAYPFMLNPLDDPIVRAVAASHLDASGVPATPAQILLRWTLQHGHTALPRSTNKARMAENLAAFALMPLSEDEMKLLDTIQYLTESPVSKAVAMQ